MQLYKLKLLSESYLSPQIRKNKAHKPTKKIFHHLSAWDTTSFTIPSSAVSLPDRSLNYSTKSEKATTSTYTPVPFWWSSVLFFATTSKTCPSLIRPSSIRSQSSSAKLSTPTSSFLPKTLFSRRRKTTWLILPSTRKNQKWWKKILTISFTLDCSEREDRMLLISIMTMKKSTIF